MTTTRERTPCSPQRMRLCLVFAGMVLLALGGCSLNRPLARQAQSVTALRPATLDCRRADHCALASPYQKLASQAREDGDTHFVNVLEHGEDALLLRLHLIRAARRSIDIQTFIWSDDEAGWLMLDELVAAARRGVRVRVLTDQLFSLDRVEWLAAIARMHRNFDFRLYNPPFRDAVSPPLEMAAGLLCCFTRLNQRMHNKLFLVDGSIGIAGGRNIADRYFDWDAEFNYRDRDVLVVGTRAGAQMQASFEQFWMHPYAVPLTGFNDVNRRIVADAGRPPALAPPRHARWARIAALRTRAANPAWIDRHFADAALPVAAIDYFSDAPGKDDPARTGAADDLGLRIAALLEGTRREVVFETPYLVLSRRARRIFRQMHKRPTPPEVIVSTNSLAATDAFYVYALSYKYKKRYLKRYGFRIHEFKPFPADAAEFISGYATLAGAGHGGEYQRYGHAPLTHAGARVGLHAKSLVIDGRTCLIGSHNFDPRSDDYNTESGFIIDDPTVASQVRTAILRDIAPGNAWTIAPRQAPAWLAQINGPISDFSAALPLFDLWPFRYTSSFELKPGCQPLDPYDPAFHDCYTDVGDFPEVALPLRTIYTRIITAFGAGLAGVF
ncbi:phospholipase D family protein [Dokdonella sp.]|uniref:phospholipase D family protein n=1 Tax=Dokdonella sp. TaxID=2291710 RepID=UPI0031C6ADD4|nr:phospholipase D family protein [Dokdonella sp.]